jgi:hypothetical protein
MSRESILRKEQEAQSEIDLILEKDDITYSFFEKHLRKFVMKKYSLEDSDLEKTDDLSELATASLSKALKISKDLVADFEAGENCEGATSSDVKRTLLLVKIQKSLSIKLSLQELMEIETIEDIAHISWPHLQRQKQSEE